MSKVQWTVFINKRAFEWIIRLKQKTGSRSIQSMIEILLLRQLEHTPGVDLSQSPYSEPKGVSDEQKS